MHILRSPKKDKPRQAKKAVASKKAPPFKKSRIPKESTPPRMSPKKAALSAHQSSPSPPAPVSTSQPDAAASFKTILNEQPQTSTLPADTIPPLAASDTKSFRGVEVKSKVSTVEAAKEQVSKAAKISAAEKSEEEKAIKEVVALTSAASDGPTRKRKSEEEQGSRTQKRKSLTENGPGELERSGRVRSEQPSKPESSPPRNWATIVSLSDDDEDDVMFEKKAVRPEEESSPGKEEERVVAEEDEKEVSRVMSKDILEPPPQDEDRESQADVAREDAGKIVQPNTDKPTDFAAVLSGQQAIQSRQSLEDSLSSIETKSARSDDVFSGGEADQVPSSGSGGSVPKPSLRERIDRFRAIFSPAPRPASSIPRLSPPKLTYSPPRPLASSMTKPAVLALPVPSSPPKSPAKQLAKQPAKRPAKQPEKQASSAPAVPIKLASMTQAKVTPSVPTSTAISAAVSATKTVPAPIPAPAPAAKAAAAAATVKKVVPVKVAPQAKVIAASSSKAAPSQQQQQQPPTIQAGASNPFQRAQQQQRQQALAATSELRFKPAPPPPSTNHIELEEPDSAYSDSDDEETVRRRQQHKPWETREGLAKALEEQATVDADMIFGIPYGAVPLDEILPAETEYARAKRARPRSSSATWSRDGLKQAEIDRYNERMGIKGPGVLLPMTTQDDGSGTPSRAHRLSAIAQSAVTQGQVSKKPSQGEIRGSMSPIRPAPGLPLQGGVHTSTVKYPQLVAGTPNRTKTAAIAAVSAPAPPSSQKPKVAAKMAGGAKQGGTVAPKNPLQTGVGSTLQTGRLANASGPKGGSSAESKMKS